jgi:DNA helicase HerA-like ATPase
MGLSVADTILLGMGKQPALLLARMANRHGLVAGATGTGKTVTLQTLAEGFSRLGVPVFLADVKGDLSGISQAGSGGAKIDERVKKIGIAKYASRAYPVCFWDVYGEQGHPVRTTISDMGPLLLARLLNLNEIQSGVLALLFKLADDNGWLLLDLKDLRALAQFAGENAKNFTTEYGNISVASIGALQRALLTLEQQGGDRFFGEPALNLDDVMQTAPDGRGVINILAADKLMQAPKVYATLLLWLLAELFERLPEVGDRDKPKLVFFFDEAHLLFDDAPPALLDRIEQVVRLVRSKGVGVYFVTQNPLDVPESVLGQLGNRVQHALRAFTPKDQKAVKAAAETFRANPKLKVAEVIGELAVGEALVSTLDEKGVPTPVDRVLIAPPESRIGPASADERRAVIQRSAISGFYEKSVDRESAYEVLKARAAQTEKAQAPATSVFDDLLGGAKKGGRTREGMVEAMTKSAARAIGSQIGRQIIRGVLGSLLGGRR